MNPPLLLNELLKQQDDQLTLISSCLASLLARVHSADEQVNDSLLVTELKQANTYVENHLKLSAGNKALVFQHCADLVRLTKRIYENVVAQSAKNPLVASLLVSDCERLKNITKPLEENVKQILLIRDSEW